MQFFLDGNDWYAGYFRPERDMGGGAFQINNMLMDSTRSSGFLRSDRAPEGAFRATVPGCDRSILLENGEIDDPYFGRNMERSRWSEQAEWAFRKEFTLPEEWRKCRRVNLIFHGAGYHAAVFLNDEFLGRGTGMFAPWVFDVSMEISRTGKNVLTMIFDPAPQALPNHRSGAAAEFAAFRHCQMSFGWDWARALVSTGIFDHVELRGSENARVRDCGFRTQSLQKLRCADVDRDVSHGEEMSKSFRRRFAEVAEAVKAAVRRFKYSLFHKGRCYIAGVGRAADLIGIIEYIGGYFLKHILFFVKGGPFPREEGSFCNLCYAHFISKLLSVPASRRAQRPREIGSNSRVAGNGTALSQFK